MKLRLDLFKSSVRRLGYMKNINIEIIEILWCMVRPETKDRYSAQRAYNRFRKLSGKKAIHYLNR